MAKVDENGDVDNSDTGETKDFQIILKNLGTIPNFIYNNTNDSATSDWFYFKWKSATTHLALK